MRFSLAWVCAATAAASLFACSSDSSPSGPADASHDAPYPDAGPPEASCPFGCTPSGDGGDASDDAPDGATTCAALKMQLDRYAAIAQACNANQTQQCSGTTMGLCCAISISPGNPAAVDDYDHAVAAYKASCPVDCTRTICSMNVPSNLCDAPMGSAMGLCE
jgi:hypothetical protein